MGFMFKCMPDSYFDEMKKSNPDVDIDYHDKFLAELAETEASSQGGEREPLDLTEFVRLLDFNRRWTYSGSLTTIPCAEGILWNVVEHVIPIRQSTLDQYNNFRKIEEEQVTNKLAEGAEEDPWMKEAKDVEYPLNGSSFKKDGDKFMRLALCNRKVLDTNDRPVYHIDMASKDD